MTKASRLRELLSGDRIIRVAGAHNGMSAKLVEEVGFDVIWAGGLEISAAYGLPDTSIVTMTEFLAVAAQMDLVTNIPIIADCDTGYGDECNVAHLVRHYERQHIAGVCIEDKVFPKINSFMEGTQSLEPLAKFVSKLRAAKSAQRSRDFIVIARTEAFIAGLDWEVALTRAEAYAAAGADVILVHSKARSAKEIAQFMEHWHYPVPIAVVPTTYASATVQELHDYGVKIVIYANQGMRAAVKAMRAMFSDILQSGHASGREDQMASVQEIFALQGLGQPPL